MRSTIFIVELIDYKSVKLFTYLKFFVTVFSSINLLSGADGDNVVEVKLVTNPPVIDGKLEDECW